MLKPNFGLLLQSLFELQAKIISKRVIECSDLIEVITNTLLSIHRHILSFEKVQGG